MIVLLFAAQSPCEKQTERNERLFPSKRSEERPSGTQIALQSALLVHPNAMHFGTGLRTNCRKNNSPDCFSTAVAPSGFESLKNPHQCKKDA